MKTLLILLILFTGCTHEITKVYIGRHLSTIAVDGNYAVLTEHDIVYLSDSVHIPDSVRCYIRINPCLFDYHPQIAGQLEQKYLMWDDEEYLIKP